MNFSQQVYDAFLLPLKEKTKISSFPDFFDFRRNNSWVFLAHKCITNYNYSQDLKLMEDIVMVAVLGSL
jgi:hypothetical protein